MTYDDLNILIPCYSLEDFPTDLEEEQAASLLNAFAVIWHPELIASSGVIPSYHPASDPPDQVASRLFILPTCSENWIDSGWVERAQNQGATVVTGQHVRGAMAEAVLAPLEHRVDVDPDLVADFYALGVCHLNVELLTRLMHHFCNIDEVHLQRETISAAEAALAGNIGDARKHLRNCFEILTEARERFYPVDCYLIDLCLLSHDKADDSMLQALKSDVPMNFLLTASDLEIMADQNPEVTAELKKAWNNETIDICGGEWREGPLPVMPLASAIYSLKRGLDLFQQALGRRPEMWGRRRFGLNTQLPQLLSHFEFKSCLHVLLDDGLYPDAEHSKVRWEGCDGTTIDAMSRIPLAVDNAASFLRFATQMSESMEEDTVGAVVFARWPKQKSPWLGDLQRMNKYSNSLGRFTTFQNFFDRADDPGRVFIHEANEYLSPFLLHAVAAREADPISRFTQHFAGRQRLDRAIWLSAVHCVLRNPQLSSPLFADAERLLEEQFLKSPFDVPIADAENSAAEVSPAEMDATKFCDLIAELEQKSAKELASLIVSGTEPATGAVVVNPCSFERTMAVELPDFRNPPAIDEVVLATQFDPSRKWAIVKVPPSGFVWLEEGTSAATPTRKHIPLVADNIIRNEFFEVHVNPATGGITKVKEYGRKPNRLSQQVVFRFPRERTIVRGHGIEASTVSTYYSEMKCDSLTVVSDGPTMGEILAQGQIIDQEDGTVLADYCQSIRMWRGRPYADIELEIKPIRLPEGDPWSNYFAARFAWNDPGASLTGSVLDGAHPVKGDRIESPNYLEIASESERTTILSHGLPFYRKTGMRMADSILIVEGETNRHFHYTIAFDQNYPQQAALDNFLPPIVVPTHAGKAAAQSGWFFHVDAPNVQIQQILPQMEVEQPASHSMERAEPDPVAEQAAVRTESTESEGSDAADANGGPAKAVDNWKSQTGFALRLVETEGRRRRAKLRCFRTPGRARQRDFCGKTIMELTIEDDAVLVDVSGYDIIDVELSFDDSHN